MSYLHGLMYNPNYLSVDKLEIITRDKTAIILTPDDTSIDFADKTVILD